MRHHYEFREGNCVRDCQRAPLWVEIALRDAECTISAMLMMPQSVQSSSLVGLRFALRLCAQNTGLLACSCCSKVRIDCMRGARIVGLRLLIIPGYAKALRAYRLFCRLALRKCSCSYMYTARPVAVHKYMETTIPRQRLFDSITSLYSASHKKGNP